MNDQRSHVLTQRRAFDLASRARDYWTTRDDHSFDPYDGLLARRVGGPFKRTRWGRMFLVQSNRRSIVDLRGSLGIPPTKNAYAVGLLASASLLQDHAEGRHPSDDARDRLDWLRRNRIGGGWAYPFDVQTKTLYYPRTLPNAISTAFAANAFLDAAELFGDEQSAAVAAEAAAFVCDELAIFDEGSPYFGYLPGTALLIHNANALVSQLVIRYGVLAGKREFTQLGVTAVQRTLHAVGPDGSLRYGEGPTLDWIDGHHTGFVIESLHEIDRRTDGSLRPIIRSMTEYYWDSLFRPDGWPRPKPRRTYPIDTISGAQGILTFAKLGGSDLARARRIAAFVLRRMRRDPGFIYQRGRMHVKRARYLRWSDAPMSLALVVLGRALLTSPQP